MENGAPRRLRCSLIGIRFERDPMLKALDITKSYDAGPLFAGLSLVLSPGERVGLVGPNGAGKSTLLRLLAGAERADRGSVTAMGRIGHLPQEAPAGAATLDSLLADALGGAGATLAELRALEAADDLDLDRYAQALLEALDAERVTLRVGDERVLRRKAG